ncbi:pentapeptide repeat-containing protein [Nostoc spongiaeforme FACHB-130]|uniref:Pentapeptide repeat-containing protein n=1 Tax=Nostoc spongiaeforme FACHB-130 TaxID=1357510 RepID=A0ABR8FR18_9NOSO|nr:pentapeptide repeat-containing protein [Nostoc spongiaeforme]MBD2593390.1 pentapeptide repeat-containing protein [Nostoc spongiaeforme FACHB-130]
MTTSEPMIKTVVEIDLKEYGKAVKKSEEMEKELEQKLSVQVKLVPELNEHIQNFINYGLNAIGKNRKYIQATNGDNAVIILDNADEAYKFAEAVHKATKLHNATCTEPSAKRLFRIGAATGELVENNNDKTLTGQAIVTAYRLEARAEAGKDFVVDVETHKLFSPEIQEKFGYKETVDGKNDEKFPARRCQIIYDNLLQWFQELKNPCKQQIYQIVLKSDNESALNKLLEKLKLIIEKTDDSATEVNKDNFLNCFTQIVINDTFEEIRTRKLNILKEYSILEILVRKNAHNLFREKLLTISQVEGDNAKLGEYIYNIINTWQNIPNSSQLSGNYAAGNLLNLLLQLDLKTDFSYSNLSNISIWNADLTKAILTGVDFSKSDLKKSKFSQPLGCIHSIAFDADGEYFATGDAHGSIRVHNAKTLELCIFKNYRNSPIWSVAFGKNDKHGRMLAWGAEDGSVRLCKIADNNDLEILRSPDETTRILSVAFSPDGNTLAIGGDGNKAIKLIEINNNYHEKHILNAKNVSCITFIDDKHIASASQDDDNSDIRFWYIEPSNPRQYEHIRNVHKGVVRCIAFYENSSSKILVSGGEDGKLKMLDLNKGTLDHEDIKFEPKISQVRTLAFNQNGDILAVGCVDNNLNGNSEHKIRLWSLLEKEWLWLDDEEKGHKHSIRSLAFSPQSDDVQLLVSGGDGRTVIFWHHENTRWKFNRKLEGYANRIWSVALSRDGKTFACGGEDHKIHLWNYHERTHIPLQTLDKHKNWVWSVAFSPNADILASGCEDNKIYLWGLQEGQWQFICELVGNSQIKGHDKRVRCVVFHPQGKTLATAGNDNRVILWDLSDVKEPKPSKEFSEHHDRVLSLAFSPNGRYLASSSRNGTIYLRNLRSKSQKGILLGSHGDQVHSIAFNRDSNLLVSGGFDKKLKLWNVESRTFIRDLYEGQKVLSVAFDPTGKFVASVGHDHIIQLWNINEINQEKPVKTFKGHKRAVESIVFTLDGKQLISCSQDQTIKLWQVEGEINISIHTIELGKPYQGMDISGVLNLDPAQISAIEELGASK